MSISSALTALNQDIQNARTAIVNKGGTVTSGGGSSQLATDIATIPSEPVKKYKLLDRVKDDSNNEIGTVSGFFTDANDVEYAVVCLDAQYRLASEKWCSNTGRVTNMPIYNNLVTANIYQAKETATENTQLILDWCSTNSYTSSACSHCRSKSFTINGTTYYGQFPNMREVLYINKYINEIEQIDTSASANPTLNFSTPREIWSSSQFGVKPAWYQNTNGAISYPTKTIEHFICPVLEIPNGV